MNSSRVNAVCFVCLLLLAVGCRPPSFEVRTPDLPVAADKVDPLGVKEGYRLVQEKERKIDKLEETIRMQQTQLRQKTEAFEARLERKRLEKEAEERRKREEKWREKLRLGVK